MKATLFSILILLGCNRLQAQIAGNASSLSVNPAIATLIDTSITVSGALPINNATVQIYANFYTGDVLSFNSSLASSFGISGTYSVISGVSGILSFTGTTSAANWQAIFRTVNFQNLSAQCGPSSRSIIFIEGNKLYNSYTQHYYQYVTSPASWTGAKAAAADSSYNGMQGYLATITSAGENNFVWKILGANAWIGGSDDYKQIDSATGSLTYLNQLAANGNEYWVTGPEAGTQFSSGLVTPVSVNGSYIDWNAGEPNNTAGIEFYTEFYSTGPFGGKWNDLSNSKLLPYLIEYGGMPHDIPQNINFSRTLHLQATLGGSIGGGNLTVCSDSNSTTLVSTADSGGQVVTGWEYSFDNFLTAPVPIVDSNALYVANNLTQTTYFRSIARGDGCPAAISSVTEIIVGKELPGTISADNSTICSGSVSNLSLAGNLGSILKWQSSTDTLHWTDIPDTTALYTTPALSTGVYYYRAQVQFAGCSAPATTNTIAITVKSGMGTVGGTLSDTSFCNSVNNATLVLSGYTGIIQKWQVSYNSGATWTDIANSNPTYQVSNTLVNTSYRVLVQNGTCNAVYSSLGNIVISTPPNVSAIGGDSAVCVGSSISVSDVTASGVWSSSNTSVASVDVNGNITGKSAGVSNISYTVSNGNGCSTSVTQAVTVNALPVVAAITGNTSICMGSTGTLSDITAAGVWSTSNGSIATVDQNGVVTAVSAGTCTISYTVTNGSGCSTTVVDPVTINPLPVVASITGNTSICVASSSALSDATASGVWSSDNTGVATVDMNGVVTGVSGGTANISYTLTNGSGCTNTVTQSITVNSLPTVSAISGSIPVCVGSTMTLSDATASGVWSSDNTSVATVDINGVVTGVSGGTANISYTVTNGSGCPAAVTQGITVNGLPVVPAIRGTAALCTSSTTSLSDTASGGVWSSDNTAVATVDGSGIVSGLSSGTANISYSVTNQAGCITVASEAVTVNSVLAVPAITGTANVCTGSTTSLSDALTGGTWSSDNTGVATVDVNGVVSGLSAGTATISYQVTNGSGCSNTVTQGITVNATPVVSPISSAARSVQTGSQLTLSDTTASGVWSSSNTGVATIDGNGVVSGVSIGTTLISYTVSNGSGCSSTATLSVQVTDVVVIPPAPSVVDSVYYVGNPQNPATVSGQVEGISGSTLNFYSSATGGSASSTAPVLPTQPGTYSYWVSQTVNGEEGPRVMFKVVIATEDVLVPKVFTPNGDGFNDVIKPVTPGIQSFHYFRIYNRWGNLVYSSTDPNQGWDGTFNGKPQPKETYLWMIEAVDLNGVTKKYSGMITLFR